MKEYKTEKAYGDYEINNVIQRNKDWKPIFITPFVVQEDKFDSNGTQTNWRQLHFLIMFEKEVEL